MQKSCHLRRDGDVTRRDVSDVTRCDEMIHLFSRSHGGSLRDPCDYVGDPGSGKDSRVFPSNRAETRSASTLRTYTRVRGGFFDSAHSSFSRSRALRNCRCQSSRRVDIARGSLARSLAAVAIRKPQKGRPHTETEGSVSNFRVYRPSRKVLSRRTKKRAKKRRRAAVRQGIKWPSLERDLRGERITRRGR